jgi:hypothetical protein
MGIVLLFAVPAKQLYEIVKALPEKDVDGSDPAMDRSI